MLLLRLPCMRPGLLGILALALSGGCHDGRAPAGQADAAYLQTLEQWRNGRVAEMKQAPGRLAYVASGRLLPGRYSVGGQLAVEADLRLPVALAALGHLELDADDARFISAGTRVAQPLQPSEYDVVPGTRLPFADGQFFVVRTGPLWGWRFTRAKAAELHPFSGFQHYPVDARWRIKARWKPYPQPRQLVVLTTIGTPLEFSMPGEASFWVGGQEHRLRAVMLPEGDSMMFMFTDRTCGRGSHSSGRNLVVEVPADGQRWIELDFNRAENPACAVTPHLVCPLAPPESRLNLLVEAGEQAWREA
jgi:uncharacterized protein